MSLFVTLSVSRCVKNTTTPATLTISGAVRDQYADEFGWIYSENSAVELSLDGTNFTDEVIPADNGTYTLYIKAGDIETSEPVVMYEFYDGSNWVESSFNIDFVPDGPVVEKKYEFIGFELAPRSSTVQFNASLVNSTVAVKNTLSGTILDYPYSFEVERISEQGARKSISGATLADKLAHSLVNYRVQYHWHTLALERPTIQQHITALSNAIGVTITYVGRTFYPKTDKNLFIWKGIDLYEYFSGSFAEHLNRLIGWSDTVPSMTHNVFVKNGVIYIIQRGYESNHLTPINWVLHPTLTHSVRRTEWSNSATQTLIPKEITSSDAANSNEPFSGELTLGTTTLYYTDGYLDREEHGDDGEGGATVTTDYTYTTYDNAKYLTLKEITNTEADTYVRTEYSYETTGVERYLHEETTEEYDGAEVGHRTLEKSTLIRHVPTVNGWYVSTVYDTTNGSEEFLSDSYSLGTPGQKASQYMIDKSNDALKPDNAVRQLKVPLRGVARVKQSYPISDRSTLEAIASCLDNYEKKEEIMLSGEIVGGNHIYTYDDTITFDNQTYYLVSNNVSKNYNTIRQAITAVRWVLT